MMRGFFLGRGFIRSGSQRLLTTFARQQRPSILGKAWRQPPRRTTSNVRRPLTLLSAALSPAAFVALSEEDDSDGKTPEEHMLEASRAEIAKVVPSDVHGLKRLWKALVLSLDVYIIEPVATVFRFFHLVIIFVPVLGTIPVIFFGARQKGRQDERSGTLWWYGFLVHSMERAGPAFIKVLPFHSRDDLS